MATHDTVERDDLVWAVTPRRSNLIINFTTDVFSRVLFVVFAVIVTLGFLAHGDLGPQSGTSPVLRAVTWAGLGFCCVFAALVLFSLPFTAVMLSRDLGARYLALADRFIIQRAGLPGGEAIYRFEDLKRVQVFGRTGSAVLINQPIQKGSARQSWGYPTLPRNATMLAIPDARALLSQLPIDVTDTSFLGLKV